MKIERKKYIGSEWLYFKIYTNEVHADSILINVVYPIFKKHLVSNKASNCFFIRYYDPDFHLRIRFELSENKYILEIINEINMRFKKYIKNEAVWNITIDSYERELVRYGKTNIINSENLFCIDSLNVINLLKYIYSNNLTENHKIIISMKYIMSYVSLFYTDIKDKIALFEMLSKSFHDEFNTNRYTKKEINSIYQSITETNIEFDKKYLKDFSSQNTELITLINNVKKQLHKDKINTNDYISSLVHMFCNRFFNANNRQMELIIYDFILKEYKKLFYTTKKD